MSEWKPASEPPSDDRWVLVYCVCRGKDKYIYFDVDYFDHDADGWYAHNVTHWRELPEGPSDE